MDGGRDGGAAALAFGGWFGAAIASGEVVRASVVVREEASASGCPAVALCRCVVVALAAAARLASLLGRTGHYVLAALCPRTQLVCLRLVSSPSLSPWVVCCCNGLVSFSNNAKLNSVVRHILHSSGLATGRTTRTTATWRRTSPGIRYVGYIDSKFVAAHFAHVLEKFDLPGVIVF